MLIKIRNILLVFMAISLISAPLAEARRLGMGRSHGYSRNISHSKRTPVYPQQPAPQKGNMRGMVGAGLAGAAIGAVAGHAMAKQGSDMTATNQPSQNQNKRSSSLIWLILVVLVGVYIFRRFTQKKRNEQTTPFSMTKNQTQTSQQNSLMQGTKGTNVFGAPINPSSSQQSSSQTLIDGSNLAMFLRFAKQRFQHVQAMNDASHLEEIQRYFTDNIFQFIKSDIEHNQNVAEFSQLQASVIDETYEHGEYLVSVRFSGLVSEELNAPDVPFIEIWHFVKPNHATSQDEWLIAGIEQE